MEAVIPEKKMPKIGDMIVPTEECLEWIHHCPHNEIKKLGCKILAIKFFNEDGSITIGLPNGTTQNFALRSDGTQRWNLNGDKFLVFNYMSSSKKFCSCENPKVVPSWVVHPDNKFFYCRKCKKEKND